MLLFDGHTVSCYSICCIHCWFMYHWVATLGLKIYHSFLSPIYRVTEYHVDGFRFDLASVLCRGTDGSPLNAPPLIRVRIRMHLHIYCYRKECNMVIFWKLWRFQRKMWSGGNFSAKERQKNPYDMIFHTIMNIILESLCLLEWSSLVCPWSRAWVALGRGIGSWPRGT